MPTGLRSRAPAAPADCGATQPADVLVMFDGLAVAGLYLRFANTIFASVWNRHYLPCVQITMAPFTRHGSVEEAWRIVQPRRDAPPPAAQEPTRDHGGWHGPWSA